RQPRREGELPHAQDQQPPAPPTRLPGGGAEAGGSQQEDQPDRLRAAPAFLDRKPGPRLSSEPSSAHPQRPTSLLKSALPASPANASLPAASSRHRALRSMASDRVPSASVVSPARAYSSDSAYRYWSRSGANATAF